MSYELFLDRSLGRKKLATALRADGWELVTLSEVYGIRPGEHVEDVRWIAEQAARKRVLVTSDARILADPVERGAIAQANALLLTFPTARLTSGDHYTRLTKYRARIDLLAMEWDVPAAYALYANRISRVLP